MERQRRGMAVIRNEDARAMLRDAVVLDLGDLQRQAAVLRQRAEDDARATIERAREEAQRIVDSATNRGFKEGEAKGYREGFERGRREGREQAAAEASAGLSALQSAWTETLAAFTGVRDEIVHESQNEVLRFALALAERVVYRIIEVDPAVVQDQLAACVQMVAGATTLRIRVHPQDATLISEMMPQVEAMLARNAHVKLEADEAIEPGGCILQTQRGGEVDARISTQIERIVQHLLPDGEGIHDHSTTPDESAATAAQARPVADRSMASGASNGDGPAAGAERS